MQLNYLSGSTCLPSIVNILEMALEFRCKMSKVKKLQREIIKKVSKLELSILCTVCLFMWVYTPTRYHSNILNFGVIEHTQKFVTKMQREITRKVSKLELCHLCAACLIIWVYIPIKVHPNTLNILELLNIHRNLWKNKYLQKMHFSPNNWEF